MGAVGLECAAQSGAAPQNTAARCFPAALCSTPIHLPPTTFAPQYGVGTASLNVAVAASIVLHHFALWAGYPERAREVRRYGGRADVAGASWKVTQRTSCRTALVCLLACIDSIHHARTPCRATSMWWRTGRSARRPAAACRSRRKSRRRSARGARRRPPAATPTRRRCRRCLNEARLRLRSPQPLLSPLQLTLACAASLVALSHVI